jgi:hypothetical protein
MTHNARLTRQIATSCFWFHHHPFVLDKPGPLAESGETALNGAELA